MLAIKHPMKEPNYSSHKNGHSSTDRRDLPLKATVAEEPPLVTISNGRRRALKMCGLDATKIKGVKLPPVLPKGARPEFSAHKRRGKSTVK